MRGDQLARRWRIIRAIEASPNALTVPGTAQAAGFPLYTERVEKVNRWAFIDTVKFKIPPPITLTRLMLLYFYKELVRFLKRTPFFDSLDSIFKTIQSILPPQAISCLDQIQSVFHAGIKLFKDYAKFREILNNVVSWYKQLAPVGETQVVFRDSAFADDVAKTNLTAILQQYGLENVRSL